jgi:hypothetical protein
MDFDTGLRTGACALSQHLRVFIHRVSVKLLSITRVCEGSIRHGTRTVYKVLTLPVETEYKSGSTLMRDRVHAKVRKVSKREERKMIKVVIV